jgi:hypothetical protein
VGTNYGSQHIRGCDAFLLEEDAFEARCPNQPGRVQECAGVSDRGIERLLV